MHAQGTKQIRQKGHNEEVTVDDSSRDDGYCGSEGPGESGRTRVLLRQHDDEGLKKDAKQLEKEAETEEEKKEAKGLTAITNAVVSKMTIKFISDKTVELNAEAHFDEQKAKEGGASWMLRKMVKLKIGKGINKKGQSTYSVNGHNVTILSLNKKDKMHFELSEDGKKLTRTDKDKNYVLDRIK